MNFKLALLFLFGFVALAVALPLEKTEENADPAEPIIAADAEKDEAPLEETEADEENDDNDEEDEDQSVDEPDNDEEDQENEMTESEDPKKPRRRGYWRATPIFKTVFYKTYTKVRSFCRVKGRRVRRRCIRVRYCKRRCAVRLFSYCKVGRKCRHHWLAHKCSKRRCRFVRKPRRG